MALLAREQLKDHFLESNLYRLRAILAALVVVVMMLLLLGRLYYLQGVKHHHFETLSTNNRVRLMAVAPTRGLIYDRRGELIAGNQPSYSLEIVPEQVTDLEKTLVDLAKLVEIKSTDLERFQLLLKRKRPFEGIPLLMNVNDELVAKMAVNRHRFPGVDIVARLSRYYPKGELAVHSLGYVGRLDEKDVKILDPKNYSATRYVGKIGVERYYEELLHGKVGFQQVEVNAEGRILRVLEEEAAQPGVNIYLSLDTALQRVARDALGDFSGSVVALDPRNGDVLTMVSKPGFDPNLFAQGITTVAYQGLTTDEDLPMFNRALSGGYPPGSTIKPFLGLAALEHRLVAANQSIVCKGFYTIPEDERKYRDWKKHGHGVVDMGDSVTQSCDVYFYDLSLKLGIERMSPYLESFGFGQQSGIDNFGENAGILPSREWKRAKMNLAWYPGETLITGIGQGYLTVTPLQLAVATATLANQGVRLRPHLLLSEHQSPGIATPHTGETMGQVEIKNQGNWQYMLQAMRNVVHAARGTAYASGLNSDYKYAGKTGTAQVVGIAQDAEYDEEKLAFKLRDHALFIGFAPVDEPRIAIAVVVEHGGSGGSVAAPMARKVLDFYMKGPS